ncbi:hypothetical protein NAF17_04335 [Mucilaginibacter sp. RB4R14]|uniref:hypothetical protein n=1 Tax=Mucilaginibacter aurantiaciroseus TaxID=2949308 RepID=UPI00209063DE|nr:hypothetical protein [Mucilaginibacter aurantiaciroseus]MCO5934758.1 hypothetical protein [Mucilaginibacter aurantiaciroseus]
MKDYLNRVLIYLKQELPERYKNLIRLTDGKFVITLLADAVFESDYRLLHEAILTSINRVRKREFDLDFTVTTNYQARDFRIIK